MRWTNELNRYALWLVAIVVMISCSSICMAAGTTRVLIVASNVFDAGAWKQFYPQSGFVPSQLHAGENDARLMVSLVRYVYGVKPEDIRLLGFPKNQLGVGYSYADEKVTRETLKREMDRLVKATGAEDRGVYYYTGHGGSIPDPGQRLNGTTQFLVCNDGPVFDFELDRALSPVQGRLTMIFDCCHSAGTARTMGIDVDAFGQSKAIPSKEEQGLRSYLAARKHATNFLPNQTQELPEGGNRVLLAATGRRLEALEIRVPGFAGTDALPVSAFTRAFYQTVMVNRGEISYEEVLKRTRQLLEKEGYEQRPERHGGRPDWPVIQAPILPRNTLPVHEGRLRAGHLIGISEQDIYTTSNGVDLVAKSVGWFDTQLVPVRPAAVFKEGAVSLKGVSLGRLGQRVQRSAPAIIQRIPKNVGVPIGGEDDEKPTRHDREDTVLEGGVQIEVIENGADNQVYLTTPSGRQGPFYSGLSKEEAKSKAEQLRQSYEAEQRLQGVLNDLDRVSAHPLGLTLKADREGFFPSYRIGEKSSVTLSSQREGYLMLIAFEPDGTISLLYPNANDSISRLTKPKTLPLTILPPAGVTRLTAILLPAPLMPPPSLLTPNEGFAHYTIKREDVDKFIDWLKGHLARKSTSRNLGVDQKPQLSPTDIDITSIDIVILTPPEEAP